MENRSTDHILRAFGRISALSVFFLSFCYAVVLILGLLNLKSSADPISDPYFTIMEILILVTAPAMILLMTAIHSSASAAMKPFSLAALIFMSISACITCIVHFTVLTVSRPIEAASGVSWMTLFFSFRWPSVIYTMDILAWDFFFALSVLFAAPLFRQGRLGAAIRTLLILSGILSLAGLLGPVMQNMQIRNIGIVGYAAVFPIACLLLAKYFTQKFVK